MFKIFSIGKGTTVQREITMLMATRNLPIFEKEIGIVEFCSDMEILYNNDSDVFLLINGFKDGIPLPGYLVEEGIKEISQEQLKNAIQNGYAFHQVGTTRMLQYLGYRLILDFSEEPVWKIEMKEKTTNNSN